MLRDAVARLNPDLLPAAVEEAVRRVTDPVFATDLIAENRRLHGLLVGGVPVTVLVGGEERHEIARLVDSEDEANVWAVYNQVDVVGHAPRIPDVVVFLNGMPLVVVELRRRCRRAASRI